MSKARMTPCVRSSHNTGTEPTLPAVGAAPRIDLAVARAKPGRRTFLQASGDLVAERGRRLLNALARRRIHLRHHRHFDLWRRRRRRQWRIEPRSAGRDDDLRRCCADKHGGKQNGCDRSLSHREYVVMPRENRKTLILPARFRSDRNGRARGRAGSTIAAYAAATAPSRR
jgi:hypothetical protein